MKNTIQIKIKELPPENVFNLIYNVSFSYWEKSTLTDYDYIIIGSGIVGLSTAASLLERDQSLRVLILERGILPTGASTRNAGFACFGSPSELLFDIQRDGAESMVGIVQRRWRGLQMLRQRLGEENIGFEQRGGYELISDREIHALSKLDLLNNLLYPVFGKPVYRDRPDLVQTFGFNPDTIRTVIANTFEGQLHTGMLMETLMRHATVLGARIFTGAKVTDIHGMPGNMEVEVEDPVRNETMRFATRKCAVCTNAFSPNLFPELKVIPGRGLVLLTAPVPDLPFTGTFHFDEGFYYFRDLGDRVLFGGGRNADFEAEATTAFGINPKIRDLLLYHLQETILPGRNVEVESMWSGIMAFGPDRTPIVSEIRPGIIAAVRMGGMGVALGTLVGEETADMLLN